MCTEQDIAYSFTDQDILEIRQAIAAVEERGLKVRARVPIGNIEHCLVA